MDRHSTNAWLERLKRAWEAGDPEGALELFKDTRRYYERPFSPGTTLDEFRTYWQDIVDLQDIKFDYEVVAVEGNTACVHWKNWFRSEPGLILTELDGMFVIVFDDEGHCIEFRQWWFMKQ